MGRYSTLPGESQFEKEWHLDHPKGTNLYEKALYMVSRLEKFEHLKPEHRKLRYKWATKALGAFRNKYSVLFKNGTIPKNTSRETLYGQAMRDWKKGSARMMLGRVDKKLRRETSDFIYKGYEEEAKHPSRGLSRESYISKGYGKSKREQNIARFGRHGRRKTLAPQKATKAEYRAIANGKKPPSRVRGKICPECGRVHRSTRQIRDHARKLAWQLHHQHHQNT